MKKLIFTPLVIITLLYSCQKEDTGHCLYKNYTGTLPWPINAPAFNPSNPDQFLCLNANGSVVFYNISTGTSSPFNSSKVGVGYQTKISWGTNNILLFSWVYFGNKQGTFVKYTLAGDSVTGPVINGGCWDWSPDCSKVLSLVNTANYPPILSAPYELIMYSFGGTVLDSLYLDAISDYSWSPNDRIAIANNYKYLSIYDSLFNPIKTLRVINDDYLYNYIFSVAWIPNSPKIAWSSFTGIYITDISNGNTVMLKAGSTSLIYKGICVSPDGNTLAANVENWNGCEETNGLHIINLNTGNEQVIYP
ncbi:MAG TPA: hypothetical protein VG603_07030 [Chitinophagales bacterium]|nr:hypothetical protein [Chitinophagales bacterium]